MAKFNIPPLAKDPPPKKKTTNKTNKNNRTMNQKDGFPLDIAIIVDFFSNFYKAIFRILMKLQTYETGFLFFSRELPRESTVITPSREKLSF